MSAEPVVILGSGLAGYGVAREFRKLDKDTPLVVVSRDHAGFYSKPQLSNALAGNKTAAMLVMKPAEKMAAELNASVRVREEVLGIDVDSRSVRLAGSGPLRYRDLVLALGADPIRIPLEGDAAAAVLSVNDLDDYGRFADKLAGVQSVAILGAGLIGCEFANDLLHRGIVPTLVEPAPRALARLLPPAASALLQQRLEAAGARFRFGVAATGVSHVDGGVLVALDDGTSMQADLVLSAIGLRPRTALAQAAGLRVNRGIVTDRLLATSAAHVYAVGDCAEVDGRTLPYVLPLMQQARALAGTLAGQHTPVAYPAMPVTVKTPACPTVVCPPALDAVGQWQVEIDDAGCEAQFRSPDGVLLGFALLGGAVSRRQALTAQVPALWT